MPDRLKSFRAQVFPGLESDRGMLNYDTVRRLAVARSVKFHPFAHEDGVVRGAHYFVVLTSALDKSARSDSTRSSVLVELRSRTASQHQALEAHLAVMRDDVSISDVVSTLRALYAFHYSLEAAIDAHPIARLTALRWPERRRSQRLAFDLVRLGSEVPAAVTSWNLPHDDDCRAIGALYVAEGSRLGGPVVAQHLLQSGLPRVDRDALTFFLEPQSGLLWNRFRDIVRTTVSTEEQIERSVDGALMAFDQLGNCFDQEGLS